MDQRWRLRIVIAVFGLMLVGISYRLVELGIFDRSFLLRQSRARMLRTVKIPANRGIILDRLQRPLAISTPVVTFWFDPQSFHPSLAQMKRLAADLRLKVPRIQKLMRNSGKREFVYLRRRVMPGVAEKVKSLKIPGLYTQQEFKRFYPQGSVTAHVLGFTNIDDRGQEGLELAFNSWLSGHPGRKLVMRDRMGHTVADVSVKKVPVQGKKLVTTLDQRIQYIASKALAQAIAKFHAESGSVVVLSVENSDVLAMVNEPSYNPNNRRGTPVANYRNRAVTDLFEPGSTIKPFTVALALLSGRYDMQTKIDTRPGRMRVGGYLIRDDLNYGVVNLTQLLQKSSNIAAAKVLLSLHARDFWHLLQAFGFGQRTQSGFPGEADGVLTGHDYWSSSEIATLAYGYGISVSALQLAHAYATLAAGGVRYPVSLVQRDTAPTGVRVLPKRIANKVLAMLETVVRKGGTGTRAAIPGYRVAGKTGTAYVATPSGYDKSRYVSSFVGVAPASNPKVVVAVVIRDPQHHHFGAVVAAPTFKSVMEQTLHILNISSDKVG